MVDLHVRVMCEHVARPRHQQRGVTSIEYALLASLIVVVIVGAIGATGDANGLNWTIWVGRVVAAIDAVLP